MRQYGLFIMVLLACACSRKPEPEPDPIEVPSQYEFLADEAPAALTKAELESVAKINGFAFRMAGQIGSLLGEKSYVYSPVSISYCLGMVSNGAAGDTRKEMCDVLGFGEGGQQELNEFNRNLMVISQRAAAEGEVLEVANAAVVSNTFNIFEKFKQSIKNFYDADVFVKDFAKDNVVDFVNAWAAKKTHDRIDHIIDDLDPNSVAIFMNALYFKASWFTPFIEAFTAAETFTPRAAAPRTEMMMRRTDDMVYYSGDKFSAVRLPYGYNKGYWINDSNYSMTLVLPNAAYSTDDVIAGLDGASWQTVQESFGRCLVELWLPRFDIEFDKELNECFVNLGMKKAFDSAFADFSAMSDRDAYINLIKQVANISVDEKGTEAAAVTVTDMASEAGPGYEPPIPVPFHCDRPFIFAITEKTTGAILFMGCYQ